MTINRLQRILLTLCEPKVAFPLVLVAALLLGPFVYRAHRIGSVPDIGDPFDVEAFLAVEVSEEDNAWPLYEQAVTKLRPRPSFRDAAWDTLTRDHWDRVDPALQQWVFDNHDFLQLWKTASERANAIDPDRDPLENPTLALFPGFFAFLRLAKLEALRHEADSDWEAAWTWYRAIYRSCLHLRLDGRISSDIRAMIGEADTNPRAMRWAQNPKVGPELLRQALDDLTAIDKATPPPSHHLKFEYVRDLDDINSVASDIRAEEPFLGKPLLSVLNEPECSVCVVRLVNRNWLAHVDKPAWQRPPIVSEKYGLYDDSAGPARNEFPATQIEHLYAPGAEAVIGRKGNYLEERDKRDRKRQQLKLHFTTELYRREQGDYPAKTEDLLDGYLDELPVDPLTGEPLECDPFAVDPKY
jgi:hypothetical protein